MKDTEPTPDHPQPDPRAADADRLLRQERGEPLRIPVNGALKALQDIAQDAAQHGASLGFHANLLAAVDVLRIAIERAKEGERACFPMLSIDPPISLADPDVAAFMCAENGSEEEANAIAAVLRRVANDGPAPLDFPAALADIAARIRALPHAGRPTVCLGCSADAFDALRALDGHRLTTQTAPPKDLGCFVVVGGVEFYAVDKRAR